MILNDVFQSLHSYKHSRSKSNILTKLEIKNIIDSFFTDNTRLITDTLESSQLNSVNDLRLSAGTLAYIEEVQNIVSSPDSSIRVVLSDIEALENKAINDIPDTDIEGFFS